MSIFKAVGVNQKECPEGGYELRGIQNGSNLTFPNVMNLKANTSLSFRISSANPSGGLIEIHEKDAEGKLLGTCKVPDTGNRTVYKTVTCKLNNQSGQVDIFLVFKGKGNELLRLNWFKFE